MKLIKPSYSIIEPTGYTIDDIYKSIELAGKVSHKSEHTIKEGSAKDFVERMIKLGHGATLEFGTVYLEYHVKDPSKIGIDAYHKQQEFFNKLVNKYASNPYSIVKTNHYYDTCFITTNYRVIIENHWEEDLQYFCEPTTFHEKRVCVKFVCDRGILAEFTRHRKFSFIAESTRYCNYSKDKFDNEITFIQPCWNYLKTAIYRGIDNFDGDYFETSLREAEIYYFKLLEQGWKPEQAREVLPLALKTELYMCGFVSDWINFFKLRDDKQHAHPQAYELAHPLHEEFINRKYYEI